MLQIYKWAKSAYFPKRLLLQNKTSGGQLFSLRREAQLFCRRPALLGLITRRRGSYGKVLQSGHQAAAAVCKVRSAVAGAIASLGSPSPLARAASGAGSPMPPPSAEKCASERERCSLHLCGLAYAKPPVSSVSHVCGPCLRNKYSVPI